MADAPSERGKRRWHRLIDAADEPMAALNGRRRVAHVNAAWEAWTGIAAADVVGRPCRPRASDDGPVGPWLAWLTPLPETLRGEPAACRRRAPNGVWCDVDFLPWRRAGVLGGLLVRVRVGPQSASAAAAPLPEKLLRLRDQARRAHRLESLESDLPETQRLHAQARLAASVTEPALLVGPPGCGKEWLARAIHAVSPRRDEPFVAVDAQPSLALERLLAGEGPARGAVFVRHLSRLSADVQAKLADALDAGPAFRLFASLLGDDDLARLVPSLRARATVLVVRVPTLVERLADAPRWLPDLLARACVAAGTVEKHLAPDADERLRLHAWPGNFRELFETLRDAALRTTGDAIAASDLPYALRAPSPPVDPKLSLDAILEAAERRLLALALSVAEGNQSRAAEFLGIWRARLIRRVKQLGLGDPGESSDA